eukprot:CAMPEP_0182418468 /NCGR_PEP_ID=MMETSP1167-20130531/2893_1 /TAXON_ID=2988 /ORGANISM="Mallomonas Sp, Strain CCMP3275" /LENGTH=89 /DNA_ID=CAMNT_0024592687 /DNA_START=448 /DNA_END=713 /DNA_ORIENTATION=-
MTVTGIDSIDGIRISLNGAADKIEEYLQSITPDEDALRTPPPELWMKELVDNELAEELLPSTTVIDMIEGMKDVLSIESTQLLRDAQTA